MAQRNRMLSILMSIPAFNPYLNVNDEPEMDSDDPAVQMGQYAQRPSVAIGGPLEPTQQGMTEVTPPAPQAPQGPQWPTFPAYRPMPGASTRQRGIMESLIPYIQDIVEARGTGRYSGRFAGQQKQDIATEQAMAQQQGMTESLRMGQYEQAKYADELRKTIAAMPKQVSESQKADAILKQLQAQRQLMEMQGTMPMSGYQKALIDSQTNRRDLERSVIEENRAERAAATQKEHQEAITAEQLKQWKQLVADVEEPSTWAGLGYSPIAPFGMTEVEAEHATLSRWYEKATQWIEDQYPQEKVGHNDRIMELKRNLLGQATDAYRKAARSIGKPSPMIPSGTSLDEPIPGLPELRRKIFGR